LRLTKGATVTYAGRVAVYRRSGSMVSATSGIASSSRRKMLVDRLKLTPCQATRERRDHFSRTGTHGRLLAGAHLPTSSGVPDGTRYVWPALPIRGEVHRRAA
jgi:hypothetical protein